MSFSPASDPGSSSTAELVALLRELGRTGRLEGYERDALRRAASELERLQPGNLSTRSEYRLLSSDGFASPAFATRALARSWSHRWVQGLKFRMEHRTVVESEWRPLHV